MNDLIEIISENLIEHHPTVEFQVENDNELIIKSDDDNGFEIYIQQSERENTIHFNSWHFHFENTKEGKNELLDYLIFGMSKFGRLKTYLKNGKEYKWTFETFEEEEEEEWYSEGTMGLINLRFWEKPEVKYYQNDLIDINKMKEKTSG
jgi:hypothetical protein